VIAWIDAVQGTPDGRFVAMLLALLAAVSHAVFGALQKGRHDPWLSRGAIDLCYGLMALPIALFLVPWPEPHLWPILGLAWCVHVGY
jgi:drug/metabolite transporter (DMT)-like permease